MHPSMQNITDKGNYKQGWVYGLTVLSAQLFFKSKTVIK